jgi:hypothetical protein
MTMIELKAAAYDILAQIERLKMQLEAVNIEIAREDEKERRKVKEDLDEKNTKQKSPDVIGPKSF